MKTNKIRDIIIIFLIIVASFFVIGEFLARILIEPIPMVVKSENEKLVYELNTYYEGINSFGMRDKEVDIKEIEDLYKIQSWFTESFKSLFSDPFVLSIMKIYEFMMKKSEISVREME